MPKLPFLPMCLETPGHSSVSGHEIPGAAVSLAQALLQTLRQLKFSRHLKQHWCLSKFFFGDLGSTLHPPPCRFQRSSARWWFDPQGQSRSLALFQLFEVHVQRHLISFGYFSRETELDVPFRLPADGNRSNHKTADVNPELLIQL